MVEPDRYDIKKLLKYKGATLRQTEPIPKSVDIVDYRNTDKNEKNISILLSSQGIPFRIERPKLGWEGTQIRMIVSVPRTDLKRTLALLKAAADFSAVEIVEGTEGLFSR